jgi:site-specific recombinase XerD
MATRLGLRADERLLTGRSFEMFMDGIRSKESKRSYKKALNGFCKFVQIDTEVLVSKDPISATELIRTYIHSLKERVQNKEIQPSTVSLYVSAIKHFFVMNDVVINWSKLSKMLPEMTTLEDRGYTKEEIVAMLDDADEREKVVVLLLATAGMRIGAIPGLKIKHVKPVHINSELVACRITVYAGTKDEYFTYCTSECYRAIQKYIEYRKRNHEKVNEDSYVIRDKINTEVPTKVSKVLQGKGLTYNGLAHILQRLLENCGVRKPGNVKRHPVKLAHGFRKFFDTTCTDNGVDLLHIEMLEGHDTKLKSSYYRPSEYKLLQSYLLVANQLTFDDAEVLRLENLRLKEQLCRHDEIFMSGVNEMKKIMEGLDVETLRKMSERFKMQEEQGNSLLPS